jgi:hypothetical protein
MHNHAKCYDHDDVWKIFFECTTWKSRLRNFRAIKLVEDVEELQKGWIDHLGHGNQNAKETWFEPRFDMQILGKYLPLQYTKENEGDQELDMQVLGGLCVIAM